MLLRNKSTLNPLLHENREPVRADIRRKIYVDSRIQDYGYLFMLRSGRAERNMR